MTYHFNVTGKDRKALVDGISGILQTKAKYMGMPSAAYRVGDYTVSKDGELSTDGDADAMERLVHCLTGDGFVPEEAREPEEACVSISVPASMLSETAMKNLERLVGSKGGLMKRAFQTDDLPVETGDGKVTFPWFPANATPEEVRAYTVFIEKLCGMAVRQKRINTKNTEVINEKYEFRCFLLRLGLIGDEFKAERKVLMRHLTGSAAFKTGSRKA